MKRNEPKRKHQDRDLLDPGDLRRRRLKPGEQNDAPHPGKPTNDAPAGPSELETVDPTEDPYNSPGTETPPRRIPRQG